MIEKQKQRILTILQSIGEGIFLVDDTLKVDPVIQSSFNKLFDVIQM